jgi:hypothetical protein
VEDICCLLGLVFHPGWHHLSTHARDQEPHCKSKYCLYDRTYTDGGIQLEELDDIFRAKNPVKASVAKRKLELDQNANVVGIVDLENERDRV